MTSTRRSSVQSRKLDLKTGVSLGKLTGGGDKASKVDTGSQCDFPTPSYLRMLNGSPTAGQQVQRRLTGLNDRTLTEKLSSIDIPDIDRPPINRPSAISAQFRQLPQSVSLIDRNDSMADTKNDGDDFQDSVDVQVVKSCDQSIDDTLIQSFDLELTLADDASESDDTLSCVTPVRTVSDDGDGTTTGEVTQKSTVQPVELALMSSTGDGQFPISSESKVAVEAGEGAETNVDELLLEKRSISCKISQPDEPAIVEIPVQIDESKRKLIDIPEPAGPVISADIGQSDGETPSNQPPPTKTEPTCRQSIDIGSMNYELAVALKMQMNGTIKEISKLTDRQYQPIDVKICYDEKMAATETIDTAEVAQDNAIVAIEKVEEPKEIVVVEEVKMVDAIEEIKRDDEQRVQIENSEPAVVVKKSKPIREVKKVEVDKVKDNSERVPLRSNRRSISNNPTTPSATSKSPAAIVGRRSIQSIDRAAISSKMMKPWRSMPAGDLVRMPSFKDLASSKRTETSDTDVKAKVSGDTKVTVDDPKLVDDDLEVAVIFNPRKAPMSNDTSVKVDKTVILRADQSGSKGQEVKQPTPERPKSAQTTPVMKNFLFPVGNKSSNLRAKFARTKLKK